MNSDHRVVCLWIKTIPTSSQSAAMDFLASRGQRFCVDFGLDNCVQKAADLMASEMAPRVVRRAARRKTGRRP